MRSETIGERVKRDRLRLGLTQRQLAEMSGVGPPYISQIEAGKQIPSDDVLRRLAGPFGVEADELVLVAGRVPQRMLDKFQADPAKALKLFTIWWSL